MHNFKFKKKTTQMERGHKEVGFVINTISAQNKPTITAPPNHQKHSLRHTSSHKPVQTRLFDAREIAKWAEMQNRMCLGKNYIKSVFGIMLVLCLQENRTGMFVL